MGRAPRSGLSCGVDSRFHADKNSLFCNQVPDAMRVLRGELEALRDLDTRSGSEEELKKFCRSAHFSLASLSGELKQAATDCL